MDYQEELKELKSRIDRFETAINALAARQGIDAENISRLADLSADINARLDKISCLARARVADIEARIDARISDIERRLD